MAKDLPIAVIGAGPVGLSAAAHLLSRGLQPLIFERGEQVGSALRDWGHVRMFSPWKYNVDIVAANLLSGQGWTMPHGEQMPTGAGMVHDYLEPLASHPAIASCLKLSARVTAISRLGLDKMSDAGRAEAPFIVMWLDADGMRQQSLARAVIDCSGTWHSPNPLGVDGMPVLGEGETSPAITYGIPDVLGKERHLYAGKRILVVGAGHSAINIILDLLKLKQSEAATHIIWALRHRNIKKVLGGGGNDQLRERGALGLAAREAIDGGMVELLAPLAIRSLQHRGNILKVDAALRGEPYMLDVDRLIVATGFRPDLSLFRELRVALDPSVEAPLKLAPMIDPNLHSCGTVPPHGAVELAHPEPGFYIAGAKSYGRAPTFLMMTGYEQVRSIAAEIAGDHKAARETHLVLPETGVCNTSGIADGAESSCCGGPAHDHHDACCMADAEAKAEGKEGCGCTTTAVSEMPSHEPARASCCGAPE